MKAENKAKVLDVGCGINKQEGAIGIDDNPNGNADVIHDLNILPWPLDDNQFEMVICSHVLEHLDNPYKVLEEIHRICINDAMVSIAVPYFSSFEAYSDLSHKHFFTSRTFMFFDEGRYNFHMKEGLFSVEEIHLDFHKLRGLEKLLGIEQIVNRFLKFYETFFAWIFPGHNIHYKLRVKK